VQTPGSEVVAASSALPRSVTPRSGRGLEGHVRYEIPVMEIPVVERPVRFQTVSARRASASRPATPRRAAAHRAGARVSVEAGVRVARGF
jgi:hypothetical protein